MIKSMTGFGSREATIAPFGKISVELRSSNHKFLEIVLHLPEGFQFLEDKIKKEISGKIKRGRITGLINITGSKSTGVFINKKLLKNYISAIKNIKEQFQIKNTVGIDTLIHLPGVLVLRESVMAKARLWPSLKILVNQVLDDFLKMRAKEGRALYVYLKKRLEKIQREFGIVQTRFRRVTQEKVAQIKTEEERSSFLKDTDITEETERLTFHIRNFRRTLDKNGPVGKELDFITQEMQREVNTIGAKSFDTVISGKVVQIKSQIEKIREQLQNIE